RRRHTRFSRDWSSDVCSSDLAKGKFGTFTILLFHPFQANSCPVFISIGVYNHYGLLYILCTFLYVVNVITGVSGIIGKVIIGTRSEERRVGKGRRSGGSGWTG